MEEKEIYDKLSYDITGAIYNVRKYLGCGFLEKCYQEALQRELSWKGLHSEREVEIAIYYRGEPLTQKYIADIVVENKIIIEIKAVSELNQIHEAQLIHYLKATGYKLGFLVNFGTLSAQIKRIPNFTQQNTPSE